MNWKSATVATGLATRKDATGKTYVVNKHGMQFRVIKTASKNGGFNYDIRAIDMKQTSKSPGWESLASTDPLHVKVSGLPMTVPPPKSEKLGLLTLFKSVRILQEEIGRLGHTISENNFSIYDEDGAIRQDLESLIKAATKLLEAL